MRKSVKNTLTKAMACALSACMIASPMTVNAMTSKQAVQMKAWNAGVCTTDPAQGIITSSISSEKEIVTVTLKIAKDTGITSGQAMIYYDQNDMELLWSSDAEYWELTDVNENYTQEELSGVSYAWASQDVCKKSGTMLTLCFRAKNPQNNQEISIATVVDEAYVQDASALTGDDTHIDTIKLKIEPIKVGPITINPGSTADDIVSGLISLRKKIGTIIGKIFN